jgi:hypothetical protein
VIYRARVLTVGCLALAACGGSPDRQRAEGGPRAPEPGAPNDSAARAFGDTVAGMLLDTHLYELRGHLVAKIVNPDRMDESPLAERQVEHPAAPGPHTYLGALTAEVGALRAVLGDGVPVSVEEDRVFLGRPPVLIRAHLHGDAVYVPVKLFARQYGAYVDISCTLANCGAIWTRDILEYMRRSGAIGSAGILEGHAEGLVRGVDVRAMPGG